MEDLRSPPLGEYGQRYWPQLLALFGERPRHVAVNRLGRCGTDRECGYGQRRSRWSKHEGSNRGTRPGSPFTRHDPPPPVPSPPRSPIHPPPQPPTHAHPRVPTHAHPRRHARQSMGNVQEEFFVEDDEGVADTEEAEVPSLGVRVLSDMFMGGAESPDGSGGVSGANSPPRVSNGGGSRSVSLSVDECSMLSGGVGGGFGHEDEFVDGVGDGDEIVARVQRDTEYGPREPTLAQRFVISLLPPGGSEEDGDRIEPVLEEDDVEEDEMSEEEKREAVAAKERARSVSDASKRASKYSYHLETLFILDAFYGPADDWTAIGKDVTAILNVIYIIIINFCYLIIVQLSFN